MERSRSLIGIVILFALLRDGCGVVAEGEGESETEEFLKLKRQVCVSIRSPHCRRLHQARDKKDIDERKAMSMMWSPVPFQGHRRDNPLYGIPLLSKSEVVRVRADHPQKSGWHTSLGDLETKSGEIENRELWAVILEDGEVDREF